MRFLLTVLLALIIVPTTIAKSANTLSIWTRAQGSHASEPPEKLNLIEFDLSGITVVEINRFDLQYQKKMRFRGIYFNDIVKFYSPRIPGMNLMLLHFKNGMIYPLRRDEIRETYRLFIATQYEDQGKWHHNFPEIKGPEGSNPKATIRFAGNKLVPEVQWAEAQAKVDGHKLFNPLVHVDSLQGIEFVDAEAYYGQFRVDSAHTRLRGRVVYLTRCQYCHSVAGVGSKFGRDFALGKGLATEYTADQLYDLIHPKGKRASNKVFMPHQSDITKSETKRLWRWLDQIRQHSLTPYLPFYHEELIKALEVAEKEKTKAAGSLPVKPK